MRLVDAEFSRVVEALDRLDLWQNTVVIFTGDHGEMNGAHRMTQKGAIPFDEAAVVNLTVCAPGGPQGQRTAAVGSHLDLAPTLLAFAGLADEEIRERYPHLKGRSLKAPIADPSGDGPRGSVNTPGDGALVCWDGLNMLDTDWALTGALKELSDMSLEFSEEAVNQPEKLREAGREIWRARLQEAQLLPRRRGRAIQAGALVQPRGIRQSRPPSTSSSPPATSRFTTSSTIPASWKISAIPIIPATTRRWSSACWRSCMPSCGTRSVRTAARSTSTCSARAR